MKKLSLEVRNLSKSFGKVKAVQNLSFTVAPGRVTGFLGPNGAGKTTTLRILLDLVRADQGSALFGGQKYTELTHPMVTVGALLDSGSVHPGRTGRDHMRVACAEGGLSPARIAPLLKLVGLTGAADRRTGGYSLGMLQRLGLATAMLGDPSVLILDEPANGLDPEGIRWLRSLLRGFAKQGRTVFLSSHLLGEIQQMAHDVVIIDQGKLVGAGSVEDLEKRQGVSVMVSSSYPDALESALRAARFTFTTSTPDPDAAPLPGAPPVFEVSGVGADGVGHAALAAGVPLTHLSEHTSGLEDLFMSLVGGNQ